MRLLSATRRLPVTRVPRSRQLSIRRAALAPSVRLAASLRSAADSSGRVIPAAIDVPPVRGNDESHHTEPGRLTNESSILPTGFNGTSNKQEMFKSNIRSITIQAIPNRRRSTFPRYQCELGSPVLPYRQSEGTEIYDAHDTRHIARCWSPTDWRGEPGLLALRPKLRRHD